MKASLTILSLAALHIAGVTAVPIAPYQAHTTQVASYDSGYDESGESIPADIIPYLSSLEGVDPAYLPTSLPVDRGATAGPELLTFLQYSIVFGPFRTMAVAS